MDEKVKENQFSTRLGQVRNALGLNIASFARGLGVPRSTLVGWEEGKSVSIEILPVLKERFRVNIEYILTGSGQMFLTEGEVAAHSEGAQQFASPEEELVVLSSRILSIANKLKEAMPERELEDFLGKYMKLSDTKRVKVMNYIEILLDQQGSEDSIPEADQRTG